MANELVPLVPDEEFDNELFLEKEDWEVEDDSLACVLNLIEIDEYDTVKELENQFDSVWIDVSYVSFVQTCTNYYFVLFIKAHLCAGASVFCRWKIKIKFYTLKLFWFCLPRPDLYGSQAI